MCVCLVSPNSHNSVIDWGEAQCIPRNLRNVNEEIRVLEKELEELETTLKQQEVCTHSCNLAYLRTFVCFFRERHIHFFV